MTIQHWRPPDALGDILAMAWAPGLTTPCQIRVRPEVHARLDIRPPRDAEPGQLYDLPRPGMVPLVIDPTIPAYPGYEIHRARP